MCPKKTASISAKGRKVDPRVLDDTLYLNAACPAQSKERLMKQPLAIILAGGRATRMGGGDKGLLPLGDATLLAQVLERTLPQVAGAAINANGDPARFADF